MRQSLSIFARRTSQLTNNTRSFSRPLVRAAHSSQTTLPTSSLKVNLVRLGCVVALSAAAAMFTSTVQSASGSSETVIKTVNSSITTFSAPFLRSGAEIGVRMSAIKLANNDLILYNPTPLDPETKQKLDQLGTVKYIVAPSLVHHVYLDPYHTAYPNAKLVGPEGISDKKKMSFVELKDGSVSTANDAMVGWLPDVQCQYFPDFTHKEIMLFHQPTKTLFVGDMLWNLPATEQYSAVHDKTRAPTQHSQFSVQHALDSALHPDGWLAKALQWSANKNTDALKAGLNHVINDWQPTTIVMEHGDVITSGAHEKLQSTYSWIKQ